jgi:hypothetical protein
MSNFWGCPESRFHWQPAVLTPLTRGFGLWAVGSILLGVGTTMAHPTLLATIGDVAHASWRSSAVGVYRLWRDGGHALGTLIAGSQRIF